MLTRIVALIRGRREELALLLTDDVRYLNPDSSPSSVLNYNAVQNLGLVGGALNGFPRLAALNSTYGGVIDSSSGFGPTNADHYWNDKQTAASNLTWVRGSHTYKLGAQYRQGYLDRRQFARIDGRFQFLGRTKPDCRI